MAESDKKQTEFKCFYETFRLTSFSMSVGMVYPNPATDKWRLLAIPILLTSVSPMVFLMIYDMWNQWYKGEWVMVAKHASMCVPFLLGFIKMILMYYKRVSGKEIIDFIDRDFAYYSTLPDKYRALVNESIKAARFYIYAWFASVSTIFTAFVGSATVANLFSHIFMAEPKLYMIYDINVPGKEPEARFESPFFEIMYFFTIYISMVYAINYLGYDGLLIACVNHACLRQNIFVKRVEDAFTLKGEELKKGLASAIKDQIETQRYIGLIQTTYELYLGIMYVVCLSQMVICLYMTNEGYEFDLQFTCVCLGPISHLYLPCLIADNLKTTSADTAVNLYCSGWENTYDVRVRRNIPFMIARAQSPVVLKAFGILTYEMDLFVRTTKTAYSLYTLLKTQQN